MARRTVTGLSRLSALLLVACVLGVTARVSPSAHHAFSSEFDASRPISLTGTVIRMEWTNPHCWLHLAVRSSSGTVRDWAVEAATPNTLLRRGLRKADLAPGTVVTVDAFEAKRGGMSVHGINLKLGDGRRVFLSSVLADFGDDQH